MLDLSAIIAPLLQLWWLLPIVAVVAFFKSPVGKGIVGEGLLNFVINVALDKKRYKLLKNVTLRTENGTMQIDHIIVSQYGVFVIETKNYKGWIFGSEHSKTWTQNIYGKKHSFQNPLHQNYKHVKTLEKLLNLNDDKVFSVVVFVGESTFKTDMPSNVVYPLGLLKYIKAHQKIILTSQDVQRIVESIETASLSKSFKTNREHVQNLKADRDKVVSKKTHNSEICPKCGNDLVIRTAKKGQNIGNQFYGCKSYPKCRYTRNIKE